MARRQSGLDDRDGKAAFAGIVHGVGGQAAVYAVRHGDQVGGTLYHETLLREQTAVCFLVLEDNAPVGAFKDALILLPRLFGPVLRLAGISKDAGKPYRGAELLLQFKDSLRAEQIRALFHAAQEGAAMVVLPFFDDGGKDAFIQEVAPQAAARHGKREPFRARTRETAGIFFHVNYLLNHLLFYIRVRLP